MRNIPSSLFIDISCSTFSFFLLDLPLLAFYRAVSRNLLLAFVASNQKYRPLRIFVSCFSSSSDTNRSLRHTVLTNTQHGDIRADVMEEVQQALRAFLD